MLKIFCDIKFQIIPCTEVIHIQCLCQIVQNSTQHQATFLAKNEVLRKLSQNVWKHSPMFVKYRKAHVCHDTFEKSCRIKNLKQQITFETKNSVSMIMRVLYSHERVLEYNQWMKPLLGQIMTFCDTKFPIILSIQGIPRLCFCPLK